MSELQEPLETATDNPGGGPSAAKPRLLRHVGLALLCAVIGLGTWQLVVLHNEVSSLQSQNHSQQAQARFQSELDGLQSLEEQAPTGGQYDSLPTDVRTLQSQVSRIAAVGTSGLYATQSPGDRLEQHGVKLAVHGVKLAVHGVVHHHCHHPRRTAEAAL